MFDIGGPEILIIALAAILVIGPRELPAAIRTVTHWVRKARGLAAEFRSGLDEMVRESELDQVKDDIEGALDPDGVGNTIKDDLQQAIDPDGEMQGAFDPDDDWYSPDEELYDYVEEDEPHTVIADDDPPADEPEPVEDGAATVEEAEDEEAPRTGARAGT